MGKRTENCAQKAEKRGKDLLKEKTPSPDTQKNEEDGENKGTMGEGTFEIPST